MVSSVQLAFAAVCLAGTSDSAPTCPEPSTGFVSQNLGGSQSIVWESKIPFDCLVYWVDFQGKEQSPTVLPALSSQTGNSYMGHAFRVRTFHGVLLKEARVEVKGPNQNTIVSCGDVDEIETQLYDAGRDIEFESLKLTSNTCDGQSGDWSCVRKLTEAEYNQRNPADYGFSAEESKAREGATIDYGYVKQIPLIPRVFKEGPGYLHMKIPPQLWEKLRTWWVENRKSVEPHESIPGGYTNNEWLGMTKLNLDSYPAMRTEIVKEMQSILQWWCDFRLKHTSTYGVRIYRRDSMLIDHVDRQDTHLASAVIQVAQSADADGGWPLEVLLPNKTVGEVYLQPGEMVLYEGAWIRHGRPMRFKGDEFANIFTHFSPIEWQGPTISARSVTEQTVLPNLYHGYEPGRCNTVGDDPSTGRGCIEPLHVADVARDEL